MNTDFHIRQIAKLILSRLRPDGYTEEEFNELVGLLIIELSNRAFVRLERPNGDPL